MKILFIILLSMLCLLGISTQAQTKKPALKTTATTKQNASTTKKITTQKKASIMAGPAKTKAVKAEDNFVTKSNTSVAKKSKANTAVSSSYKAALGLKFIYGVSATGKFFISNKGALEAIVRYNNAGGEGTNIAFTALYEHHSEIKAVEGLRWYIGGGGYINHFSWKDNNADAVNSFGVSGVIGLEYKIKTLPVAISADWVPGYVISPSTGFSPENGGIGIKYTF